MALSQRSWPRSCEPLAIFKTASRARGIPVGTAVTRQSRLPTGEPTRVLSRNRRSGKCGHDLCKRGSRPEIPIASPDGWNPAARSASATSSKNGGVHPDGRRRARWDASSRCTDPAWSRGASPARPVGRPRKFRSSSRILRSVATTARTLYCIVSRLAAASLGANVGATRANDILCQVNGCGQLGRDHASSRTGPDNAER